MLVIYLLENKSIINVIILNNFMLLILLMFCICNIVCVFLEILFFRVRMYFYCFIVCSSVFFYYKVINFELL